MQPSINTAAKYKNMHVSCNPTGPPFVLIRPMFYYPRVAFTENRFVVKKVIVH